MELNKASDRENASFRYASLVFAFAAAMLPARREGIAAPDFDDGQSLPPSIFASQAREILRSAEEFELALDERAPASSRVEEARLRALPARFVSQYVASETRRRMRGVSKRVALETARAIVGEANRRKLDPLFVMAIIQHESQFRPRTLGGHGEIGLMQIKPSTAAWVAARFGIQFDGKKDLLNPVANVRIGVAYVALLKKTIQGRGGRGLDFLSAYNMGPTALRSKFRVGVRPRVYVARVMEEYVRLRDDIVASAVDVRGRSSARTLARAG